MPRRIAQGTATEEETASAFAAWALAQIMPFRSVSSNTVMDPLRARIEGGTSNSLRDDGLGMYVWGADSVTVFQGSGFFLHVAHPDQARGPIGPYRDFFRRSITFDLTKPVLASGAKDLGVVSDNEAYVWIWHRRIPETGQVITFRELPPSEVVHPVERIEMHFRIGGVLHILQMGPFVEGQGGAPAAYTGMHGEGTTLGEYIHPTTGEWIVRAPTGSVARLWRFDDRAKPTDQGLYAFSLQLRFFDFPDGPRGACVPYPQTCRD
jgi:hypothetical protein